MQHGVRGAGELDRTPPVVTDFDHNVHRLIDIVGLFLFDVIHAVEGDLSLPVSEQRGATLPEYVNDLKMGRDRKGGTRCQQ